MESGQGRATIARPVVLSGHTLHSGEPVRMRLGPAPPEHGVVFRRTGPDGGGETAARIDAVVPGRNATTLAGGGVRVTTVEHVLAAVAMLEIDDLVVELDADEPPAVDGSALPFVELLQRAGRRIHGGQRRVARILAPVAVDEGERSIVVEPASALAVEYAIDFPTGAIGHQVIALGPVDPGTFVREVAGARTFGLLEDAERLREAGLARGASLANTVVVDGDRVVNPEGLRWPDECVRHKVLDLLGDLALLGMPLIGRVRVRRGGHALHHALLRALCTEPRAWAVVEAPGRAAHGLQAGSVTTDRRAGGSAEAGSPRRIR
jgi:UDP-3-O-[3-hydroxymyristoyl] N-acetylglucosamine deacetylase